MVTSKHSQVLQNRHFAEIFFGGVLEHVFRQNILPKTTFGVEKANVGDHLKRVFPKFEAEWSHPRVVNDRSKFR